MPCRGGTSVDDRAPMDFADGQRWRPCSPPPGRARKRCRVGGSLDFLAAAAGDKPAVGMLARVGGVPAAITFGVIDEKVLNISYTAVDPAFHGRGLRSWSNTVPTPRPPHWASNAASPRTTSRIGPSGCQCCDGPRSGSATTQWPPTWRRLQHCRHESCRPMAALTGGRGASFRPNAGPLSKGELPAEVITPMTKSGSGRGRRSTPASSGRMRPRLTNRLVLRAPVPR
jgi:hypothetical protein